MIEYEDLIGIPCVDGGRTLAGLDCYGLVMEVYRRFGITLPEFTAGYDDEDKISEIIYGEMEKPIWRECRGRLPVPCIAAIRLGVPRGVINHTGVYIGNGKFIHARSKIGVCVNRIDSPAWRRVIEGFYQYMGDAK